MILGAALAVPDRARAQGAAPGDTSLATAAAPATDTRQAMIDPSRIVTPGDGEHDIVADGRKIFNGTCSHCHGPDAVVSARRLDLRQLRHRYGDNTESVFEETVTKGRPAKGMPNWSKVFTEDKFREIYAYLNTIQTE
jgi:mono/diheme cytochrome c family protein